jgi:hypothetical protein
MYTTGRSERGRYPLYKSLEKTPKVVPFLYTDLRSPVCAVLNQGIPVMSPGNDLEVEVSALSSAVISRVHRTGVASGRCFCCQYVLALSSGYSETPAISPAKQRAKLEKDFVQRMKFLSVAKDADKREHSSRESL